MEKVFEKEKGWDILEGVVMRYFGGCCDGGLFRRVGVGMKYLRGMRCDFGIFNLKVWMGKGCWDGSWDEVLERNIERKGVGIRIGDGRWKKRLLGGCCDGGLLKRALWWRCCDSRDRKGREVFKMGSESNKKSFWE